MSVNILIDIMEDKLATKQDLKDLHQKLETTEWRLTVRMGGMLAASIALITTLNKFI